MCTVDKAPRVRNVAEASRRVLDPLQKLRGYIRLYVSLEAAALALLFVAACFWISLTLDYGAFKIPFLSIDWVQKVPWNSLDDFKNEPSIGSRIGMVWSFAYFAAGGSACCSCSPLSCSRRSLGY